MVSTVNPLSYGDCFDVLDKALEDPKGVRVEFDSEGDARHFRLRLHAARRDERNKNKEVYEIDHPMYGRSQYDGLVVKLKDLDGIYYVYVTHLGLKSIQSLSELEEADDNPDRNGPPALVRRA